MNTLMARSLDGVEMFFGIDEVTHVISADNVFYIGDTPCAIDSVDCLEAAQLRELAETQALLINEKNDEIASLTQHVADLEAALAHAQSHSYADDLEADCEAGAIEVEP